MKFNNCRLQTTTWDKETWYCLQFHWPGNSNTGIQFDLCKLDTKFDAAKAAEPPTTETRAAAACNTISQTLSSGTKYTHEGPKSNSPKLRLSSAPGVPGSVAADKIPSSSALDRSPNFSIDDRDNPAFSAADSSPAFSALLRSLNCSTLVSSLIGGDVESEMLLLGPFSPRGNTVEFICRIWVFSVGFTRIEYELTISWKRNWPSWSRGFWEQKREVSRRPWRVHGEARR